MRDAAIPMSGRVWSTRGGRGHYVELEGRDIQAVIADELYERWEKIEEESPKGKPESPLTKRDDITAFLLLDKLQPGTDDMVSCAEHDQIWLGIDTAELAKVITDEIRILVLCGVHMETGGQSLYMFR
jgi:hypothetical protein